MVSEATGRAVEFLVLAFAVGLALWMLCQIQFTKTPDRNLGDGGSPDDGAGHHHGGWGDHAGGDGGADGGH